MTREIQVPYKDQIFTTLVDDEDYPLLSRYRWEMIFPNGLPYVMTKIHSKGIRAARLINMQNFILGEFRMVDHADRDTLNNQKSNLRVATRNESEWNKGKNRTARGKPCSSRFKGVSLNGSRWLSQIKRNGILYKLGYFTCEIEAAKAYNAKAIELSGKFAWVNPLPEDV